MRLIGIIGIILHFSFSVKAQTVFSVTYSNQADLKGYVVPNENQADLKVYKVKYTNQSRGNKGEWFFTKYANQAKKKVYFVSSQNQADLKIYYVKYTNQAGWKNKSKSYLLE